MSLEIAIPELGESITEAQIGQWRKNVGDRVERDEPLVELETDKATMELPAPSAGTLEEILKKSGDTVGIGEVIARLSEKAASDAKPPARKQAPDDGPPKEKNRSQEAAEPGRSSRADRPDETPKKEKLQTGSSRHGDGGDGEASRTEQKPAPSASAGATSRPIDASMARLKGVGLPGSEGDRGETIVPMSAIRAQIAGQLADARRIGAVTTTFDEADMSALIGLHGRQHERFEKEFGVRLSYTSFFVRAVAESLRIYPQLNAELRGTDIFRKHYCDIAVSLDADGAAVAPVIRDADELSVARIEEILADFVERAASRRLSIEDLRDATFTISNPGAFGSVLSTPGVSLPQCACLALHAIRKRPVARGEDVVVRPMMHLALSFDQRIVDLADACGFLRRVRTLIEAPIRALLES